MFAIIGRNKYLRCFICFKKCLIFPWFLSDRHLPQFVVTLKEQNTKLQSFMLKILYTWTETESRFNDWTDSRLVPYTYLMMFIYFINLKNTVRLTLKMLSFAMIFQCLNCFFLIIFSTLGSSNGNCIRRSSRFKKTIEENRNFLKALLSSESFSYFSFLFFWIHY